MSMLDRFVAATRDIVAQGLSPEQTTSRVRKELIEMVRDPELLSLLEREWKISERSEAPPQTVIHEDSDYGFQVLAHVQRPERYNPPHTHGPCWVLYSVCTNSMEIRNYRRLDNGGSRGPAELVEQNRVTLRPGDVSGYVPGMIHATYNPNDAPTIAIRVTSRNLDPVERERFDLDVGTVEPMPATT